MSKVTGASDATTLSPLPPPDDAPTQGSKDAATLDLRGKQEAEVNVARTLRDGLQHMNLPVADTLSDTLDGLGLAARFSDNLFGETQYAQSGTGRAAAAAADTLASVLAERAFDDAIGGPTGSILSAVSSVDALLDADDAPKILTSIVSNLDPSTLASNSADLLGDLATVGYNAVSEPDLARVQMEQINTDAMYGEYGEVLQGVSLLSNAIASPDETAALVTGDGAAAGDLGVLVAWGNAVADMWSESGAANAPPQWVSMEEVERRQTLLGALF